MSVRDYYLQGQITAVLTDARENGHDLNDLNDEGWMTTSEIATALSLGRSAVRRALLMGSDMFYARRGLQHRPRAQVWGLVEWSEDVYDRLWREACEAIPDPTLDSNDDILVPTRQESYDDYLRSDVWQRTRELALEYYGERCCLCYSVERLNVHHRTYERKGHERLSNLIVLCRDCHAWFHRKSP